MHWNMPAVTRPAISGTIGVYAGCGQSSYFLHHLWPNRAALGDIAELRVQMGNNPAYLATRLSYQLNLTGPSVAIRTACSTSLVAVHMACDALRDYQCDIALAGGVSIQLPQDQGLSVRDRQHPFAGWSLPRLRCPRAGHGERQRRRRWWCSSGSPMR